MDRQYLIAESYNSKKYNLYMTFNLEDHIYAAEAQSISEVIKLPLLNIPESLPDHLVGIVNLRGNIINILDIRSLLGIPSREYSLDNCILVLTKNDVCWGLIVDSVNNVQTICIDQITATPYRHGEAKNLIKNVAKTDEGLMGILNLDYISSIISNTLDQFDPQQAARESELLPASRKAKIQLPMFAKDPKSLDIFKRRARELQKELNLTIEERESTDQRFVTFLLNNEMYGISLKFIREFSKIINLALIPCVPEFYVGLSNLRGEFIPVVDIKGFLGISKTEITDKSKIIFAHSPRMQLGIIVDEVFDIITVSSDKINKSGLIQVDKSKYTSGEIILDNKKVINIFDIEKFLQDERLIIEEAV